MIAVKTSIGFCLRGLGYHQKHLIIIKVADLATLVCFVISKGLLVPYLIIIFLIKIKVLSWCVCRDYRDSAKFLDSLSDESKNILKEEKYNVDAIDWKEFTFKEEKIVSTTHISCIDSFGDMVTFGTAAGRVGILLGGKF